MLSERKIRCNLASDLQMPAKKQPFDISTKGLLAHSARLIPTPRSKPEAAATTSLLAVVGMVDEFGSWFLKKCGGPSYQNIGRYYSAFTETDESMIRSSLGIAEGLSSPASSRTHDRPDGLIVVDRNREWRCLIEVKVGSGKQDIDQISDYYNMAHEYGFDALVTISNEPANEDGTPPVQGLAKIASASKRKKVPIIHFSWRDLVSEALALHTKSVHRDIEDEDQHRLLGEWLRFVQHDESGILIPGSLGDSWADTLKKAKLRLLQKGDPDLANTVQSIPSLVEQVEFSMRTARVKLDYTLPRKLISKPALVQKEYESEVIANGSFELTFKAAQPVRSIYCKIDLASKQAVYHFKLKKFHGKSIASEIHQWTKQIPQDRTRDLIARAKFRKPSVEVAFELSSIAGARDLKAFLKERGVTDSDSELISLSIEQSVSLEGRPGRGGRNHMEQIVSGMRQFYGKAAQGLREIVIMPEVMKAPAQDLPPDTAAPISQPSAPDVS
jgi:hypothetical protein